MSQIQSPSVSQSQSVQSSQQVESSKPTQTQSPQNKAATKVSEDIVASQTKQTSEPKTPATSLKVSSSSEDITKVGKGEDSTKLSETAQDIFTQVDSFSTTALKGREQISKTPTDEEQKALDKFEKLENAQSEMKSTLSALENAETKTQMTEAKEKLTELLTTLKENGLPTDAETALQGLVDTAEAKFAALMSTKNTTISLNQEANLDSVKSQVQQAFSATKSTTVVNVLSLCEKYVAEENKTDATFTMDKLVAQLDTDTATNMKDFLAKLDKMPTDEMKALFSLASQAEGYKNADLTTTLTAKLDTFKAAQSGKLEDMQKAWDLLDDTFMRRPAFSHAISEAKASFIADANDAHTTLLNAQHTAREAVAQLLNSIPNSDTFPSVSKMGSENVLEIIKLPPTESKSGFNDFYALDTFMQLAKLENPKVTNEAMLGRLSPENQAKATAVQEVWKSRGITSSTQLKNVEESLANFQLDQVTTRALLHSFKKALPFQNAIAAEKALKAFAQHTLKVNSLNSFSPKAIVELCTKYLKVDLDLDKNTDAAVNDAIIQATALVYSTIRPNEEGIEKTLDTTFRALQEKQMQDGVNKTRGQKFLSSIGIGKKDMHVLGETYAYSMLSLQKMLVTDAKSLSQFDRDKIGLTDEILNNETALKTFAVGYLKANPNDRTFVASALCQSLKNKYVKEGKTEVEAKALIPNFEAITQANSFSDADFNSLVGSMSLSKAHVNLGYGITNTSVKDDDGGKLLKDLVLLSQGKKADLGLSNFTIDNISFRVGPSGLSQTAAKEALLALLNTSKLTVTPNGADAKPRTSEFTNPILASQALVRNRTSSLGKETGGGAAIGNANSKVFAGLSKSAKGEGSAFARMEKALQRELSQVASMRGRQQSNVDKLSTEVTAKLFENSRFTDKIVPLILNAALTETDATKSSFFASASIDQQKILSDIVKSMGASPKNADVIAHALIAKKDDLNVVSELYQGMAQLTTAISSFDTFLLTPPEARNKLKSMEIAENSMTILGTIGPNSGLDIGSNLTFGLETGVDFGFVEVGVKMRAGETKGMTLWRGEDGKPTLNIRAGLIGELGLSATAFASLGVGIEGGIEKNQGLKLSFADDAACAQFMGKLLSSQATKDDFKLTSAIGTSSGTSLRGGVSAGIELSASDPLGVCTAGVMLGASLQGELVFRQERNDKTISVITEGYYNFDANATAEASVKNPVDAGKELLAKGFLHETSSVEIPELAVSKTLEYNANVREITKVDKALDEKSIIAVEKTTQQNISSSNPIAAAMALCDKLNVPASDKAQIMQELEERGASAFSISVSKVLSEGARARISAETTPEEANKIMSDPKNYEYSGVTLSFSANVYQAKTTVLSLVSLEQQLQSGVEVTFPRPAA